MKNKAFIKQQIWLLIWLLIASNTPYLRQAGGCSRLTSLHTSITPPAVSTAEHYAAVVRIPVYCGTGSSSATMLARWKSM